MWKRTRLVPFLFAWVQYLSEHCGRPLSLSFTGDRLTVSFLPGRQCTLGAHFVNDLGLDSLDAVEIVIALEEEFGTLARRWQQLDCVPYPP